MILEILGSTVIILTELVNHDAIKKVHSYGSDMSTKKTVPGVSETFLAENFKAKCKYCAKEINGSVRTTTKYVLEYFLKYLHLLSTSPKK